MIEPLPETAGGPHTRPRARLPLSAYLFVLAAGVCVLLDPVTHGAAAWAFVALVLGLILWGVRQHSEDPPVALAEVAPPPGRRALFHEGVVLGLTGFGGGLAVLAQIERRLAARRRWISADTFLESAALGQSLPGAVAFNALGFIGWRLGGVQGAVLLVLGFVLPSFLILLVFALLYPHLRHVRVVEGLFAALTPAVVGLVAASAVRLGAHVTLTPSGEPAGWRGLMRDRWSLLVMLVSAVAVAFFGIGVVETLVAAGLMGVARELAPSPIQRGRRFLDVVEVRWRWLRWRAWVAAHREMYGDRRPWWRRRLDSDEVPGFLPVLALTFGNAYESMRLLGSLAGIFLRAGALTFGGGFVMIPLLEAELVQARHWLTPQAFADAMALGQVTPGPVVITATFVGYVLAGLAGALASTAAVFLPSFAMVLAVSSSMERFRTALGVQAFLTGVQPAVVGLMVAATISLARNGLESWVGVALAVIAFALLARWRLNPVWVVIGAATLGLVESALRVLSGA